MKYLNLGSRIGNIEKALGIGRREVKLRMVVSAVAEEGEAPQPPADADDPRAWIANWRSRQRQAMGPVRDWLTYRQQLTAIEAKHEAKAAERPAGTPDILIAEIRLSVPQELEARNRRNTAQPDGPAEGARCP